MLNEISPHDDIGFKSRLLFVLECPSLEIVDCSKLEFSLQNSKNISDISGGRSMDAGEYAIMLLFVEDCVESL